MKTAKTGDRHLFKKPGEAGKGDTVRPRDNDKWYNAPLWKNFGPDSRKQNATTDN